MPVAPVPKASMAAPASMIDFIGLSFPVLHPVLPFGLARTGPVTQAFRYRRRTVAYAPPSDERMPLLIRISIGPGQFVHSPHPRRRLCPLDVDGWGKCRLIVQGSRLNIDHSGKLIALR
jgi:hypothetical protein